VRTNNNGLIDSGAELFGDATQLASGQRASDGFAALADLDENQAVDTFTSLFTDTLPVSEASNDFYWRKQA
jgi:hypothetical protein